MGKTKIDNILSAKGFAKWNLFYCDYTGFHTVFFVGGWKYQGSKVLMQYNFTSWKIAPDVPGVLDIE